MRQHIASRHTSFEDYLNEELLYYWSNHVSKRLKLSLCLCLELVTPTWTDVAGVQHLGKLQRANLEIIPGLVPLHCTGSPRHWKTWYQYCFQSCLETDDISGTDGAIGSVFVLWINTSRMNQFSYWSKNTCWYMSEYISRTLQSSWFSFLMDLAAWTAPWEPSRDIWVCEFILPQHKSISDLKILHEITRPVPLRLLPNQLLCGKVYWGISWPGMDGHFRPVFILLVGYYSLHYQKMHWICVYYHMSHTDTHCRSSAQLQLSRYFVTC